MKNTPQPCTTPVNPNECAVADQDQSDEVAEGFATLPLFMQQELDEETLRYLQKAKLLP